MLSCETPACFYKTKHLEDGYTSNNSLVDIEIPGLTLENQTRTDIQQKKCPEKHLAEHDKKEEFDFSKVSECNNRNVINIDDDDNTQDLLIVSMLPGNAKTTITSPPCVSNSTRIETSTPHVPSSCGETKRHFFKLKQKLNHDSPITQKESNFPTDSAVLPSNHHSDNDEVISDSPPPTTNTPPVRKRKSISSTTESISSGDEAKEYGKTPRRRRSRKRARREHSQQSIVTKPARKTIETVSETSESSEGDRVSESDTLFQGSTFCKPNGIGNTSTLIESPPVCSGSWLSTSFQKQTKSLCGRAKTPTQDLPKSKSRCLQKVRNADFKALLAKSDAPVTVSSSESDEEW